MAQGQHVVAASRHQTPLSAAVQWMSIDLDQPAGWPADWLQGHDTVFYLAPPPVEGVRDSRLRAVLARWPAHSLPQRFILISTTAVYGDRAGAWVDEQSPIAPGTDRGHRRHDAEQVLTQWATQHRLGHVILRVAGIYGPGRLPLQRLRSGMVVINDNEAPPSNRIHVEDLAAVCIAAAAYRGDHHVFNVSDGHPTTMTDYFVRVARLAGLSAPRRVTLAEAPHHLSAAMMEYLMERKKVDNRRMLTELGVVLQYPDLEHGLSQALAQP